MDVFNWLMWSSVRESFLIAYTLDLYISVISSSNTPTVPSGMLFLDMLHLKTNFGPFSLSDLNLVYYIRNAPISFS